MKPIEELAKIAFEAARKYAVESGFRKDETADTWGSLGEQARGVWVAVAKTMQAVFTWHRDDSVTLHCLCLVSGTEHITEQDIAQWTDAQCQEAEEWATALHYNASDNDDVVVPPRPEFLKRDVRLGG